MMNAVNMNQIMFRSAQATKMQSVPPKPPKMEVIENEKELLMNLYKEYLKQVGGFQEVNGQRVHVTTALHLDQDAQKFVMQIQERLKALGAL